MTVAFREPQSARAAEVVLVTFDRGEDEMRRSVLQVFSKEGVLLAEHDSIHADPVWASFFLRGQVKADWLKAWAESQDLEAARAREGAHG